MWDTSWLLTNGSIVGQAVHILTGYEARPAGMQLVFWAVTFATLAAGMGVVSWHGGAKRSAKRPADRTPATANGA
jgi:high-affinity iron transporter